ncbi:ribonuclease H-like domain-containing protein [Syncephalastrum racemosum]|uniref:Ribonuclease H-like domain-containing protein n=1 Tax=Syncephalastrum racemosum TaxID=13706 RepID=A0A1X2HS51_SYNRA|nr:ribonuclease H-like domain-containing protein [Syncephalastrum racemosum]
MAEALSKHKSMQLQSIAKECGIASSGTKQAVKDRILNHVCRALSIADQDNIVPASVVSIDLGFKNLGIVHISADRTILSWDRHDFCLEENEFHPSVSAPKILQFVRSKIQTLGPVDAFIIEQQRWRQSGGSAVLENTIRVNSIESMLWIALYGLNNSHSCWMEPVSGQAVAQTWRPVYQELFGLPPASASKTVTAAAAYYRKKKACTKLVHHWIHHDQVIQFARPDIRSRFLNETKQDDMSDCLLQAIAWLQWREKIQYYVDHEFAIPST